MVDDDRCLICGVPGLEHIALPPPTWHYEDRMVNGRILRTPILDGHSYLPPSGDDEELD